MLFVDRSDTVPHTTEILCGHPGHLARPSVRHVRQKNQSWPERSPVRQFSAQKVKGRGMAAYYVGTRLTSLTGLLRVAVERGLHALLYDKPRYLRSD